MQFDVDVDFELRAHVMWLLIRAASSLPCREHG